MKYFTVTALYSAIRNPTRIIIIIVFIISMLAGAGFTKIGEKNEKLSLLILSIVFIDLMLVNGALLRNTFEKAPVDVERGDFMQC